MSRFGLLMLLWSEGRCQRPFGRLALLMLQHMRAAVLLPLQALLGVESYCKAAASALFTLQCCLVPV